MFSWEPKESAASRPALNQGPGHVEQVINWFELGGELASTVTAEDKASLRVIMEGKKYAGHPLKLDLCLGSY